VAVVQHGMSDSRCVLPSGRNRSQQTVRRTSRPCPCTLQTNTPNTADEINGHLVNTRAPFLANTVHVGGLSNRLARRVLEDQERPEGLDGTQKSAP